MDTAIKILDYQPAHQPWFEKFNRQWIEKYFEMEPLDYQILQHPEEHIIKKGGSIFMGSYNGELAGTVALKLLTADLFELTKMAVDERFQGKKIGQALATAALARAKEAGAKRVILYSNTLLEPAMAVYKKLGFQEIPVDGPYKRTNIKMELVIQ
jgi:GNAT superfamily N-acetyltransferase